MTTYMPLRQLRNAHRRDTLGRGAGSAALRGFSARWPYHRQRRRFRYRTSDRYAIAAAIPDATYQLAPATAPLLRLLGPAGVSAAGGGGGKRSATALVADHHGRIVQDLFEFELTVSGMSRLVSMVAAAERRTGAASVRAGIESAGHYHRALATTLQSKGFDIVEPNPYHVKTARVQMGQSRVKTDLRNCLAMAEVLVRGQGWEPHSQDGPIAEQRLWTARSRRNLLWRKSWVDRSSLADLGFPRPDRMLPHGLGGQGVADAAGHPR